ncbi:MULTISPECIES: DUF2225 domain-containing protein [Calothrix]|uniref:DUF2225 domain-containing protein n=1 Tax=Calothrix TaxID=1186 RepID=UPI001F557E65|nr:MULTISPECIES: DUF2225 domain-containing protein [Calothrix]
MLTPRVGLTALTTCLATFFLDGGLVSFGLAEDSVLTAQVVANTQVLAQTPNPTKTKADQFFTVGSKQLQTSQFAAALESLQTALEIYRQVSDRSIIRIPEAETLNKLGEVYRNLGETQTALKQHEQALAIFRELSNLPGEGVSLHNIAAVYETQGKYETALKYYQEALLIRRTVRDKVGEANTLIGLGNTYLSYIQLQLYYQKIKKPEEIKPYNDVLKYYEKALAIMRFVGNDAGEAWSLNGIGMSYGALGNKEEALDFYKQALTKMREVGDRSGEATVIFNLGKDYNWKVDPQRDARPISLDFYEQALNIAREIQHRPLEAKILTAMGFTYKNEGRKQPEAALDYFKQALPVVRQIGDRFLEEKILNSIGYIYYFDKGEPQTAQEYQEQALAIRRDMGIHLFWPTHIVKQGILVTYHTPNKRPTLITFLEGEALTHYRNGDAHAFQGRYQAALESYQQALAIVRQQKNRPWEWVILNQMGRMYEIQGLLRVAFQHYQQSLAMRREVGEEAAKAPIPDTIRVAYGTKVNVDSTEGIKLTDAISNGLIKVGSGEPITQAITTVETFKTPEEISAMEKRGQRLQVVVGTASWESFAENEEEDTLTNIGDIYQALQQYQNALDSYKEALTILRAEMENKETERREIFQGSENQQEQRIKRSMGATYAALGQHQAALQVYQELLAIASQSNSPNHLAIQVPHLLMQIGKAYENLGQYPAALEAYQKSLAIARDSQYQSSLSSAEFLWRQYGKSEYFRRYRIAEFQPNHEAILKSIATIYDKLGQPQAAESYRQQAVVFKQEITNNTTEEIAGKQAILITEVGRDESKKPLVQIHRLEGDAVALFATGNSYTSQGQYLQEKYQFALQSYQKALAIVRQQKNRPWEAVILTQMGLVYEKLGQTSAALAASQQALAIKQEIVKSANNQATLLSKPPLSGAVNYQEVKIQFASGKVTTFKSEGGVIFFSQTPDKLKGDRLFQEGKRQSRNQEYSRAIKTFEAALAIYQQLGDKAKIANCFYELGEVYNRQKNEQQALKYYQQALSLYKEIGDTSNEKASLNAIGNIYYQQGGELSRKGQYRQAIEKYQQVVDITTKLGQQETKFRAFNQMAIAYSSLGEYKLALDYYHQALPIRNEILGDWVGIEFNIGRIYQKLGQYELAVKYYNDALKTARRPTLIASNGDIIGDFRGEVNALNAIGNIHYKQEKYDLALDYHRQALTVVKKVDAEKAKKLLEATTFNNIGLVYFKQGKYQLALDFLQPALTTYQQFDSQRSEWVILHNIGKVYFEQGKYDLARKFLQQSLVIAQEIGNKEGEGIVLNSIGYLLEKQNKPELAIIFFKQSVNAREAIRQNIRELPKEYQESYTETIAKDYRHLADILLQ